jgi:hypothetical protein
VTTRGKNIENNPFDRLLDHLAKVVVDDNESREEFL